jgi:hypothetical protein
MIAAMKPKPRIAVISDAMARPLVDAAATGGPYGVW